LRGRNLVIGIIVGIIIGSFGTFFLLNTFPFIETNILNVKDSALSPLPLKSLEAQDLKPVLITNNLKYSVLDVRKSSFGVKGEKPLEGGTFVITKIEIENIGKTEAVVYGTTWNVQDDLGRIFKPKSFDAQPEDEAKRFSIQIPPGFKVTQDIGFEVPSRSNASLYLFVADSSSTAEPILLGQIL
jgi:hypothetical protein